MRTHTVPDGRGPRLPADARALLAAALLFAGILAFVSSCGSGDLVFPGQPVPTSAFTNTPGPSPTP